MGLGEDSDSDEVKVTPSIRSNARKQTRSRPPKDAYVEADLELNCGAEPSNSAYTLAISTGNHVVTTISDGKIRVFSTSTRRNPIRTFLHHEEEVTDIAHLCDDIVASVDTNGCLITWDAATNEKLDDFSVGDEDGEDDIPDVFASVHKLDETTLIIGCDEENKNTYIVQHTKGRRTVLLKHHPHHYKILGTSGGCFFTSYEDQAIKKGIAKRNSLTGELLKVFQFSDDVKSFAANEKYIAFGCDFGLLSICRNDTYYTSVHKRPIKTYRGWEEKGCRTTPLQLRFINEEVLMVTTDVEGLLFFHIAQRKWIGHLIPKGQRCLFNSSILSDARICASGNAGYCAIFTPPANIALSIVNQVGNMRTARLTNEINKVKGKLSTLQHEKSLDKTKLEKIRGELDTEKNKSNKLQKELDSHVKKIGEMKKNSFVKEGASAGLDLANQLSAQRREIEKMREDLLAQRAKSKKLEEENMAKENELKTIQEQRVELQQKVNNRKKVSAPTTGLVSIEELSAERLEKEKALEKADKLEEDLMAKDIELRKQKVETEAIQLQFEMEKVNTKRLKLELESDKLMSPQKRRKH